MRSALRGAVHRAGVERGKTLEERRPVGSPQPCAEVDRPKYVPVRHEIGHKRGQILPHFLVRHAEVEEAVLVVLDG